MRPTADTTDVLARLARGMQRQHVRLRAARAAGMPRLGWKICVNERASQQRLGLAGPFVGFLDGARCFASGSLVEAPSEVLAVEPEIAIRVSATLAGDASLEAARGAIAALAPALEVVDYAGASFELESLVEGSSFHAGLVLGAPHGGARAPAIGPGCPALQRDGREVAEPDPALVPADLGEVVLFVARFLREHGEALEEGDWILSGACARPVRVGSGDHVRAELGFLGTVEARFVASAA